MALSHLPSPHPTPTGVVLKGDVTLETAAEGVQATLAAGEYTGVQKLGWKAVAVGGELVAA